MKRLLPVVTICAALFLSVPAPADVITMQDGSVLSAEIHVMASGIIVADVSGEQRKIPIDDIKAFTVTEDVNARLRALEERVKILTDMVRTLLEREKPGFFDPVQVAPTPAPLVPQPVQYSPPAVFVPRQYKAPKPCIFCDGRGDDDCPLCVNGIYRNLDGSKVKCNHCEGTGRLPCTYCNGTGRSE